jgi:hypothetical protein
MPQEDPKGQADRDRRFLWDLYGYVTKTFREQGDDSYSYQELSRFIDEEVQYAVDNDQLSAKYGKSINGVQGLLNHLEIEDALGEHAKGVERAQGALANIFSGATLGGADEIAGAVRAAVPGGMGYEEGRAFQQNRQERFAQEHPVRGKALEFGGMAVPAMIGGKTVPVGPTSGGIVGKSVLGAGRLGALGAGEGALAGTLAADQGSRGTGGAIGGALGGTIGGIAGLSGPVLAATGRQAVRAMAESNVPLVQQAGAGIRRRGIQHMADQELQHGISRSGQTPEQLAGNIADIPEGRVIDAADALGRRGRAAMIANPEGVSMTDELGDVVAAREAQAAGRMASTLRDRSGLKHLGDPDTVLNRRIAEWDDQVKKPFFARIAGGEENGKFVAEDLLDAIKITDDMDPHARRVAEDLRDALRDRDVGVNLEKLQGTGLLDIRDGWSAAQILSPMRKTAKTQNARAAANDAYNLLIDTMEKGGVRGFSEFRAAYEAIHTMDDAYRAGRGAITTSERDLRSVLNDPNSVYSGVPANEEFRRGLVDAYEQVMEEGGDQISKLRQTGGAGDVFAAKVRHTFPPGPAGEKQWQDWMRSLHAERAKFRSSKYLDILGPIEPIMQGMTFDVVVTRGPSLLQGILANFIVDPTARREIALQLSRTLNRKGPEAMMEAAERLAKQHRVRVRRGAIGHGLMQQAAREAGASASGGEPRSGLLGTANRVRREGLLSHN